MHYLLAKQEVREFLLLWFTLRVQITLSPGGAEFVWTAASVFCTTTIAPRRETQLETEKNLCFGCLNLKFYLVWLILSMLWNPRPFIFPGVSLNPNPQIWPLNKSLAYQSERGSLRDSVNLKSQNWAFKMQNNKSPSLPCPAAWFFTSKTVLDNV